MTLEEQMEALKQAQDHYEADIRKYGHRSHEEATMCTNGYTPVEKNEDYASKGVAGTGLGLGIAGTALWLLNSGNGLGGILGGGQQKYLTKDEAAMMQQLTAKDSEIALLKADKYTDIKISDTYKELASQIGTLRDQVNSRIDLLKDGQAAINCQQAVLNATQTAQISCMQQQVAQLQSLTKLVVPNGSVCPGWGGVTITPASTASTTTPAA